VAEGFMKIVINKCYGGFGLSPRAVKRLAELNGKPCFFFKGFGNSRVAVDGVPENTLFFSAYTVPNPDEVAGVQENWHAMSVAERAKSIARWEAIDLDTRPGDRADPKLIQVVEELGDDASGQYSKLRIVEIPDGTDYEISEYDGMERVEEKHQSWD
jgi:hypothetical protein